MSEIDKLTKSFDNLQDKTVGLLLKDFPKTEKIVFNALRKKLLNLNIQTGTLQNDLEANKYLLQLEKIVKESLFTKSYDSRIDKYIRNFDEIDEHIKGFHGALNDINISISKTVGKERAVLIKDVGSSLKGARIDQGFIAPLRQALYRHILYGGNVTDAENILNQYIITNPEQTSLLKRYVTQVSRDGIREYNGAVQNKIAEKLKMDAIRYIGSIIEDSRGQCVKWVGMKIIAVKDFQKEINWAVSHTGSTFQGHKIQGMMPNTIPDNFASKLGGYNCKHSSMATFSK